MAWVKIPKEHHALFLDALPRDAAITTVNMFGGIAALVNGNMFGGLFARSAIVKLDAAGQAEVLAMDGGARFDPIGNGRTIGDTVVLPEEVMDNSEALRRWLDRALAHTRELPPKRKKAVKAPRARTTATRAAPAAPRAPRNSR